MASINVGSDILKSLFFFFSNVNKSYKIFLFNKKALKKMTPIDKTKPIGSLH